MVIHKSSLKRVPDNPLPVSEAKRSSPLRKKLTNFLSVKKRVFESLVLVEIKHNNNTLYLNKTTAVCLLQEGERVSSDRPSASCSK